MAYLHNEPNYGFIVGTKTFAHHNYKRAWRRRKVQLAALKDNRRFEKELLLHSATLTVFDREDGSGETYDCTKRSRHVREERTALLSPTPAEVSSGMCISS